MTNRPPKHLLDALSAIRLARAKDAANALVRQRYLLAEDVDQVMKRASDHWDLRAIRQLDEYGAAASVRQQR